MTANDGAARIAELEADTLRLRRLLDQQNVPGELRHRLRNTVAMLRTLIRRSADTERDLAAYVGHLEDRLDALARAQSMTDEHGSIELHRLLADELLHYGVSEDDRAQLAGPDVHLQPQAGQMVALAVHELAVNAVEHGALGVGGGRLAITWTLAGELPDGMLTFIWKETGGKTSAQPAREGFGTRVLMRMLAYELEARTELDYEPDGLRCTIRFPLTERIGRVHPPRPSSA